MMNRINIGLSSLAIIICAAANRPSLRGSEAGAGGSGKSWFVYNSYGFTSSEYQNVSNYSVVPSQENGCGTANQLCEIYATIYTVSGVQRPVLPATFGFDVAWKNENGAIVLSPQYIDGVYADFCLE